MLLNAGLLSPAVLVRVMVPAPGDMFCVRFRLSVGELTSESQLREVVPITLHVLLVRALNRLVHAYRRGAGP